MYFNTVVLFIVNRGQSIIFSVAVTVGFTLTLFQTNPGFYMSAGPTWLSGEVFDS